MSLPFGYYLETDFNGLGLLFWGLFFIALIFTILNNRHHKREKAKSASKQFGHLIVLRSFAVLLMLLLVINPKVALQRTYAEAQKVAVVVDQSGSMHQAWDGTERELNESIENLIEDLEQGHDIDLMTMKGNKIEPSELKYEDEISTFSWQPMISGSNDSELEYSSVILVSDGHLNGGRSPLDQSWSSTIPVYPVYPLKPTLSTNLKILDCSYEKPKQDQNRISLKLSVQQSGLDGRSAIIQVKNAKGQILEEQPLALNSHLLEATLSIKLPDQTAQKLLVSVASTGGDLFSEKTIDIPGVDPRQAVLIVTDRINELHKFLIQSFSDSSYDVTAVTGTLTKVGAQNQAFLEGKYDLIILNQPGNTLITKKLLDLIAGNKAQNLPVILFQSGTDLLDSQLAEILDVEVAQISVEMGDQSVYWSPDSPGHAFYLSLLGRDYAPEEMIKYAPIDMGKNFIKTAGTDLMLAGVGSRVQPSLSITNTPPMAIFNGEGYWKWFFHPQSKASFIHIWDYLLIYLKDISNFKPVSIKLPMETASTGALVEAQVTVRDVDNVKIHAAELRAWQENESGERESLDLIRKSTGEYTAQVITSIPGLQMVVAEAYRFGELWGRDTSRINLMSFNGENQSKGVDELFLMRLATKSGGQLVHYVDDGLPMIPVKRVERSSSLNFKGNRSMGVFILLVITLIFEWIMRRRSGLL